MELSQIIETAKTAEEILPNTVASVDGVVSAIVNVFNDLLLYPIKKANLTFRYKLEQFENDLAAEISRRKIRILKQADVAIIGPTIEAMRYSMDIEELRKMYIKLLASSVDADMSSDVHPSFVEIIKRMDTIDARVFKALSKQVGNQLIANPIVGIKSTGKYFVNATPQWYMASLDSLGVDVFRCSSSYIRLSNLGLVDLMYDRTAGNARCDWVLQSVALKEILVAYQRQNPDKVLELKWTDSILSVNDYGKQFARICL